MTSIKVVIKVRPLIQREKDENLTSKWSVVDETTIKSDNKQYVMSFDKIFDETRATADLFEEVARPIVSNALKGINGTIFAYGQTSSGKTYCMMGTDDNPGIVPLTIAEIFKQIETLPQREFLIRVGYIEIYNEKIFDLLNDKKQELAKMRDGKEGEINFGQTELISPTAEAILDFYNKGNLHRRTEETGMNDQSSRSHSIFRIVIESKDVNMGENEAVQVSTLNLVDLAGSERADQTKATGDRLREGGHINKSLLALSKVIRELSEVNENSEKLQHIPYRDSKLTRILSASLGGNAQTAIICTITPASLEESFSTLTFASNAKKIKNRPKINEIVSDQVIMNRMRREIRELKHELEEEKRKANKTPDYERIVSKIIELEGSLIHHHSSYLVSDKDINRRRTWMCPSTLNSSTAPTKIPQLSIKPQSVHLEPPPPFILSREHSPTDFASTNNYDFDNEVFTSPSKVNLDRTLSPMEGPRTTEDLKNLIHTPRALKPIGHDKALGDSPIIGSTTTDPYARIAELEQEIEELKDFKLAEEYTTSKETENKLKIYETEINELKTLCTQKDQEIEKYRDYENKLFLTEKELKKVLQERRDSENILASTQFEFELSKEKSKKRETELLAILEEARNESKVHELNDKIKNLQKMLKKAEEELFTFQSNASILKSSSDDSKAYLDRIKELESEIDLFRKDREENKLKIADLEKENSKLSSEVIEAVQDAENLQQKITKLEADINAKNSRIEEVEKEQLKLSDEVMENIQEADRLQKELDKKNEENQTLTGKIEECCQKIASFERIQEMLINGNVEEINEEDEFGKIILKMHHDSSKTASLELEKLQLLEEINSIRATVVTLSDQLMVYQKAEENEQQLKIQVEILSEELIKTKKASEENEKKNAEQYSMIDDLRCKLEEIEGSSVNAAIFEKTKSQLAACDGMIDDLKQQVEKLHRENSHMAATLKECESFETDVEMLTKQKEEMQATIEDLLSKVPVKVEVVDKSVEIFGDSINESAMIKGEEIAIDESEAKNDLSKKLEESLTQISKLTEKIAEYEKTIAEKTLLHESLMVQLEEIKKLNNDAKLLELKNEISSKNDQIASFEIRIDEMSCDLTNKSNIAKDYQELQQKHRELINEKNKLMETAEELSESNDKLQKDFDNLKSQINVLEQEKSQAMTKIDEYLRENDMLKMKLAEMESLVAEKHESESMEKDNKIVELEEKIQSLEDLLNLNNAQNTTDDDKTKLETELVEIKAKNDELRDQVQVLNDEIKSLNDQVQSLNENNITLQAFGDEMKSQLDITKSKLIENTAFLDCVENELEKTTKELDDTKRELVKKQVVIDSSKNKLETAKATVNDKIDKISSLECQLIEVQAKFDDASKKIQELTEMQQQNSAGTQSNFAISAENYEEKLDEIQQLKNQLKVAHSNLDDKTEEIKLLDIQLETLKKDFHDTKSSLGDAMHKIHEMSNTIHDLQQQIKNMPLNYEETINDLKNCVQKLTDDNHILTNEKAAKDIENEKLKASLDESNTKLLKLDATLTNFESRLIIKDEKIEQLECELKKTNTEFDEAKTRLRRRSVDTRNKTDSLEAKINELIKQLGETEALKANSDGEVKKLREERDKLKARCDDDDMKYAVLDEKHSQLIETNGKLQNELKSQKILLEQNKQQIDSLNTELSKQMSENFTNSKMVGELRDKLQQLEDKKKLSVSPKHRRSNELESDNVYTLQHKALLAESQAGTPARRSLRSNQERKTRRNSVYDDNRRLSIWERFLDAETQTEPTDELCACSDLREKLKKVTKDFKIYECKVKTMERMANANPLKVDLQQAQNDLEKERRAHVRYKELLNEANHKIEELSKNQKVRVDHVTRSVQVGMAKNSLIEKTAYFELKNEMINVETQLSGAQQYISKLEGEKNVLQAQLSETKQQISKLEDEKVAIKTQFNEAQEYVRKLENQRKEAERDAEKENIDRNSKAVAAPSPITEPMVPASELAEISRKYELAKRLCTIRNDKILEYTQEKAMLEDYIKQLQAKMTEDVTMVTEKYLLYKEKYEHARSICEIRFKKLQALRVKYGEPEPTAQAEVEMGDVETEFMDAVE